MIKINSTNVTIMVKEMDRSIQFYESIGLTLKQRWDDHYAMIETTGLTIGLHPGAEDNSNSGTVSIGFMVDDINDAKTLLEKNNLMGDAVLDDGKSDTYLNL